MDMLYNQKHTKTDVYSYEINGGGKYSVKEQGQVEIIFVEGKFAKASYPFLGIYSRNGWRILAAVEKEIATIEAEQAKDKP